MRAARIPGVRFLSVMALTAGLLVGTGPLTSEVRAQSEHTVRIARVQYDGGGDWYADKQSLPELLEFVRENTLIDAAPTEEVVQLDGDRLFSYPYLYLTGHGNVEFSAEEARRLRRYLTGGGFLHIDDNYGLDEHIREEMNEVFPENEFVELPFDHPIYHSHFEFSNGLPAIHEHDPEEPPRGFGIVHEGRLVVFYSYESDLGDGWEPAEVHDNPPEKRQAALRMGTNILAYAMMN